MNTKIFLIFLAALTLAGCDDALLEIRNNTPDPELCCFDGEAIYCEYDASDENVDPWLLFWDGWDYIWTEYKEFPEEDSVCSHRISVDIPAGSFFDFSLGCCEPSESFEVAP